jgi:hypothetical protein
MASGREEERQKHRHLAVCITIVFTVVVCITNVMVFILFRHIIHFGPKEGRRWDHIGDATNLVLDRLAVNGHLKIRDAEPRRSESY